jgi:hypothetical protein
MVLASTNPAVVTPQQQQRLSPVVIGRILSRYDGFTYSAEVLWFPPHPEDAFGNDRKSQFE